MGEAGAARAAELLADIAAAPRPAGGEEEARVRALCAERLARAGLTVQEETFSYSSFPGRFATPLAGIVTSAAVLAAGHYGAHGRPVSSVGVVLLATGVLALGGRAIAARVATLPLLRDVGVNLVATRGNPRVWMVAHLDSKSQPVPMLLRVAGIVVAATAMVALLVLAIRSAAGAVVPVSAWHLATLVGVLASLPVIASVVGARSPGALDDASGVATVLLALERLPRDLPVGVLLSSAEELGMAGAQAFATGRRPASALNVDGVDDRGAILCMRHGAAPRPRIGVAHAAQGLGMKVRESRTIPGLLTDGVALANAGWAAVTLSRGTLATLWRIHRRSDNASRLRGSGVNEMARLLARAVREIA